MQGAAPPSAAPALGSRAAGSSEKGKSGRGKDVGARAGWVDGRWLRTRTRLRHDRGDAIRNVSLSEAGLGILTLQGGVMQFART